MRAVTGKTAIHAFRAKPPVKLESGLLGHRRGDVIPLSGSMRNTLAPGTQVDDTFRAAEPVLGHSQ